MLYYQYFCFQNSSSERQVGPGQAQEPPGGSCGEPYPRHPQQSPDAASMHPWHPHVPHVRHLLTTGRREHNPHCNGSGSEPEGSEPEPPPPPSTGSGPPMAGPVEPLMAGAGPPMAGPVEPPSAGSGPPMAGPLEPPSAGSSTNTNPIMLRPWPLFAPDGVCVFCACVAVPFCDCPIEQSR